MLALSSGHAQDIGKAIVNDEEAGGGHANQRIAQFYVYLHLEREQTYKPNSVPRLAPGRRSFL